MCHWLQTPIARFQQSSDDRTRQLESDRTLDLSVQSRDTHHVSPLFEYCTPDLNGYELTGRYSITDRTLSLQRPVVSSKLLETAFLDRTRPVALDRTQPASGQTP